jgi:hypothetical protein
MSLIEHLERRWKRVAPAFAQQRTADQVLRTLLALLAALGQRTIAAALVHLGREQLDWSGRYRHFSRSPWEPSEIFRVAALDAVALAGDHPFIAVSLDDTALPTTSDKGGLASYGRDPCSPKFHVNLRRGLRQVHAAIVVPRYQDGMRPLAVSTAFDLCVPVKKPNAKQIKADPQALTAWKQAKKEHNLSVTATEILARHRTWFDDHGLRDKPLLAVVDGSYTNKRVIRNLPERTHLIGRCRKDIVLYEAGPKPHRYGKRASTPDALRADDQTPWKTVACHYAGATHDISYKELTNLRWRATGTKHPVRIFVLRPIPYTGPGGRRNYRQSAYIITTDLTTDPALLIQAYLDRWQIEVLHRDLKHDLKLGTAQVRATRSVTRLHAAVVAINALLQLAAHDHHQRQRPSELPPLPAWRKVATRRNASQQDLIALLRLEMARNGMTPPAPDPQTPPNRELLAQAG